MNERNCFSRIMKVGFLFLLLVSISQTAMAQSDVDKLLDERLSEYQLSWNQLAKNGIASADEIEGLKTKALDGINVEQLNPRQVNRLAKAGFMQSAAIKAKAAIALRAHRGQDDQESAIVDFLLLKFELDEGLDDPGQLEKRIAKLLRHPGLKTAIKSATRLEVFSLVRRLDSPEIWQSQKAELFDLCECVIEVGPTAISMDFVDCFDVLKAISEKPDGPILQDVRLRMVTAIERAKNLEESNVDGLHRQLAILKSESAKGKLIGAIAPELNFIWSSDEELNTWSKLSGKAYVLDFWTPSCAPCVKDLPKLAKLNSRLPDDIKLIGITSPQGFMPLKRGIQMSRGDVKRECQWMKEYAAENNITWPVVYTKESVFNVDYGVRGVPLVVVVNQHGIICDSFNPAAESLDSIESRIKHSLVNSQQETSEVVTPESLKAALTEQFENNSLPGLALTMVKNSKVVFQNSFGKADVASGEDYSNATIQPIGSISKTFIAVATMKAIELGHFNLDTEINSILPFKVINPNSADTPITVKHLVTHTSGIIDRDDFYFTRYWIEPKADVTTDAAKTLVEAGFQAGKRVSLAELLRSYLDVNGRNYQARNFQEIKAGERYEYTNLGSSLAAYVIEVKSGVKYSDFVQKHIFDPLEMNDSRFVLDNLAVENSAKQYFSKREPFPLYVCDSYPDGAVQTSNRDMAKFMLAMMQGWHGKSKLLKPATFETMFKPLVKAGSPGLENKKQGVAVFWDVSESKIGHNGGDPGVMAMLSINPENESGFFVMINLYPDISSDPETTMKAFRAVMRTAIPLIADEKRERQTTKLNEAKLAGIRKALETAYDLDQKFRRQFKSVEDLHGRDSDEFKALLEQCKAADSANLKTVVEILDQFGWLGADQVGESANRTLFLVLQHADRDRDTQKKYLPMLREAVSNKKASPMCLAMLEDRLAVADSLPQVYGSQLELNKVSGKYQVSPVKDVATLDDRRAKIGLQPMSEYLQHWDLNWIDEKQRLEKLESKTTR